MMNGLTQKQETFAQNLFKGMSQREAWIQAGYSSKYPVAIIDQNACRMAATSKVKARLRELNQKAEDASVATVLERKQVLSEMMRARQTDFMTLSADGAWMHDIGPETMNIAGLKKIRTTTEPFGPQDSELKIILTEVELIDPTKAIDLLNKMEKLYTDGANVNIDNRTLTINVNSEETKDLTERLLAGERTGKELE